jgi:glycerol kinase
MNLRSGHWDVELCRLFDVPIECLPEIVPSTGNFGTIPTPSGEVLLSASIVDQQAALYGFDCRQAGQAKITFGTGAFALMSTGHEIHHHPEKGLLPTVAWQKKDDQAVYAIDGGVYTASAAINWAKSLGLFSEFNAINQFDTPAAIDSGLIFVPALTGLACPHWDPRARGQWLGLSIDHGPRQLVQSILEGVAFRAAEVLEAMDGCVARTGPLQIDGGMSCNPYFVQFLADILDCPVNAAKVPELTGLGTALLAADGAGIALSAASDFDTYLPENRRQPSRQQFAEAVEMSRQWAERTP